MTPTETQQQALYDSKYLEKMLLELKQGNSLRDLTAKTAPKTLFMGIEIELTLKDPYRTDFCFSDTIQTIANSSFGNHVILKSDSSIGHYGMEIVTIPATLGYHKQMFAELFSKESTIMRKLKATSLCGIHVHISKNALTLLEIGKLITFINAHTNDSFIEKMANRELNHFCSYMTLRGVNSKGVDLSAKYAVKACVDFKPKMGMCYSLRDRANRYVSVNLQNANTIEIRIFKSSSDKNNILRKLEFCESLVMFVRQHSMQQMSVAHYVKFILAPNNKNAYPHLVKWLAAAGYIQHTRKMITYRDGENNKRRKLVHNYTALIDPPLKERAKNVRNIS